jgi:pyridoxal phosphate-dependent aminotransferase EpsN
MPQAAYGLHTNWLSCFLVDPEAFGASRDDILAALADDDIEGRPLWKPMHLQPLYGECERYGGDVSERLFERGLCLPSSSSLTPAEQDEVIDVVRGVARGRSALGSVPALHHPTPQRSTVMHDGHARPAITRIVTTSAAKEHES